MAEITASDVDDVANFLRTTFGVPAEMAADYARIAVFLSVEKLWQPGMAAASDMLQDQYQYHVIKRHGNRLTSAISAAAKSLGFSPYAQGVILAGFTSVETFKDYVKKRAFWKDAVSSNHGEHSHSLQWLAIGIAARGKQDLSLTKPVSTLYQYAVDFSSTQTFLHSGRGEQATIYLRDFLVDCFDFGTQQPDYKTNIHTQTARSPTYVNKYLFQSDLWIGKYLTTRYDTRGWGDPGTGTPIKSHAINKATQRGFSQTASNSGGNYVYERPGVTNSTKIDVPGGTRRATLQVLAPAWGLKGENSYSVEWKTQAAVQVSLPVTGTIPEQCKAAGSYQVDVSLERNSSGNCCARIVAVH